MGPAPFFSILIPSYNRPIYLAQAIKSVLESRLDAFEIIVSDDLSPGSHEVRELLRSYKDNRKVRSFAQPRNIGMVANWNFLTANARGSHIMLMGDDDLLLPHTLERLEQMIRARPDYDLFGMGYEVVDDKGHRLYQRRSTRAVDLHSGDPFAMRQLLLAYVVPFWICHPFTICYRASLASEVAYSTEGYIGADLLFLYDCMRLGKRMTVIPEVLFSWRKFALSGQPTQGLQANLSAGINGLLARGAILRHIEMNWTSYSCLTHGFTVEELRRSFLYDSFLGSKIRTAALVDEVIKADPRLRDLMSGFTYRCSEFVRLRVLAQMINAYFRICGIGGVPQIARNITELVGRQRHHNERN